MNISWISTYPHRFFPLALHLLILAQDVQYAAYGEPPLQQPAADAWVVSFEPFIKLNTQCLYIEYNSFDQLTVKISLFIMIFLYLSMAIKHTEVGHNDRNR